MVTKKTPRSTKKKLAKKSTEKNFVVKYHSSLTDPNLTHDTPMFYSESGQGWGSIGSATRYSESGADKIMLELLKEDKIVSELLDLNVKPDNIFTLHTVFLNNKNNIPQIITKVPQFTGDTYHLIPFNEDWFEEDLVDVLKRDDFTALYDTNIGVVPKNNEEFLASLGYEFED